MKKNKFIINLLFFTLFISIFVSLSIGTLKLDSNYILHSFLHKLGFSSFLVEEKKEALFWMIRLPRIVLAILVGALLGSCGVAIQALFRNPLVDPSIIGISSGSTLFAVLSIVLISPTFLENSTKAIYFTPLLSFLGAILTTFILFSFSYLKKSISFLLLLGIAMNALFGAFTALVIYMADDLQLRSFTFWTLGSLAGGTWNLILILSLTLLISFSILFYSSKELNILSLGEEEAENLGVKIKKLKTFVLIAVSLGVSLSVAFCGFIGFVGLVVPHVLRKIGGHDHRFLLPASALMGACLLVISDSTSRVIVAPSEIPIGVITSLLGSPIFLFILIKGKKIL